MPTTKQHKLQTKQQTKEQTTHANYNNAFFKRIAPFYSLIEIFLHSIRLEVVKLAGKPPKKIIDFACGPGPQTYELAKAGHFVIGIDLSPDMLAHAKRPKQHAKHDPHLQYIQQDATATNFKDSEFDISTISFALHDMPETLAIQVLKEMKRVTKKGGQIIVVEHNDHSNIFAKILLTISTIWETKYFRHFLKTGLKEYLKSAQLKPHSKKTFFFGNMQMVEIINTK
jgi:ubiquinone/menaquinone biosynthesis C-methylase UbiE